MTESGKHGRLLWAAAGVIILCTLISRSAAVLYSFAATDILYAEGVLPDLLTFLRQFFAAAAFGAGIASVTAAAVRGGGRLTAAAAGIHIAVLLADALAAFLIDALSGAVRAALLPAAALMNLGEWLFGALLAAIISVILRRMAQRGRDASRMLGTAALIHMGGRLALQMYAVTVFLIEVEFSPYASELTQIVGEVLGVLFMSGGVVWLSALAVHALLARISRSA